MEVTRRGSLMLGGACALAACTPVRPASNLRPADSLDSLARRTGRRFGSAVSWSPPNADRGSFANPAYASILERECGVLVPENELKWQWTRRNEGQFEFKSFDAIADYATSHNFLLRGHTLFWTPTQWYPEWLKTHDFGARPASAAAAMLTEHVQTVARRYGKRIYSYDVVNEAVQPETGEIRDTVVTKAMGAKPSLI
ncbi:endo-1,4-beta-xylanase [Sphingomonas piscis]|uniref:endo-1,4-beta-xylanase n=1 Tax=Sphingomonas piscis TaxID=2714943 RepID=UPI001FE625FC|nr:endo-1,4-beta-xylanase [Sphingomonas piscis]